MKQLIYDVVFPSKNGSLTSFSILFSFPFSFSSSLALALSLSIRLCLSLSISLSLPSCLAMFISCKNMLPWDMTGVGLVGRVKCWGNMHSIKVACDFLIFIRGIFYWKCWSMAEQYLSHSSLVAYYVQILENSWNISERAASFSLQSIPHLVNSWWGRAKH